MKHGHKHHTQHDRERDAAPQPAASQPDTGQQAGESPEETALAPEAIAELQAKAAERDKWHTEFLYKAAELENMRKRAAKERQELIRYSGQDIFAQLLEVVDNFGRAVDADRKETDPAVIVQGLEIIYKQLLNLLDRYEIRRIPAKGNAFDPALHDAIQQVPTPDAEPGTVIEELLPGYYYRDRVLRPARVIVAAAPPPAAAP
ncbi:nucleotide exchange factor GrpE [bacterium]|nr:nucleotide exchange factor GrpE [bacterium]